MAPATASFVRAHLLRDLVVAARRVEPSLLAGVADHLEAQIGFAGATSWLPGSLYVSFHEDALAVVGERGVYALGRSSVATTVQGPFLSTFVALGRKMSAGRPYALMRWFAPSRTMLFRGTGETTVVETELGARVDICGLPELFAGARGWRIGTAGVLHGCIDIVERVGEVHLDEAADDRNAVATFHVDWWTAGSVASDEGLAAAR